MEISRWPLAATTAAIAFAFVSSAQAQVARPRLKIIDHGAEVEVVVSDVRLTATPTMKVNRERIELPLAGHPAEVNDEYPRGLVMRIDVRADGPMKTLKTMSVKLRREHDGVVALAKGATARQDDDGVHLWVPIAPPSAAAASTVPVPVPVPANAAATGATATLATPATPAPATPTTPPAPPKPTGAASGTSVTIAGVTAPAPADHGGLETDDDKTAAAGTTNTNTNANATTNPNAIPGAGANGVRITGTGTGAEAATEMSATTKSTRLTGGDAGAGPGFGQIVIAIGAIGLAGGAIVMLRRRRGVAPAASGPTLEILASKSLGGKTRIVWLGAGDRELVVAVAATQVNLLGQWRRGEADRPIERAIERSGPLRLEPVADDVEPAFAAGSAPMPRMRGIASSAVSGIMRLRGKVTPIADDIATGDTDADEQWARDILAATGGGRR